MTPLGILRLVGRDGSLAHLYGVKGYGVVHGVIGDLGSGAIVGRRVR